MHACIRHARVCTRKLASMSLFDLLAHMAPLSSSPSCPLPRAPRTQARSRPPRRPCRRHPLSLSLSSSPPPPPPPSSSSSSSSSSFLGVVFVGGGVVTMWEGLCVGQEPTYYLSFTMIKDRQAVSSMPPLSIEIGDLYRFRPRQGWQRLWRQRQRQRRWFVSFSLLLLLYSDFA